ncbi:ribosomal large subunit pseudouridine synthase A domain protein [Vibrio parahaemolyticus EKP-028]|nr:ribosomal large subunit pseudouridine synthase A domain protein [Vibrio parahaemolyticus EKP-028]
MELHASELSFYHPKSHWLRSIFVPCDFYPEAEEMIFDYFDPERKLPDYKTLPRP